MWPLGMLLTLATGWLLASVVVSILRNRHLPPNGPRRKRTACLVAAAIVAGLAFACAATAMLVDMEVFGPIGYPVCSLVGAVAVGGLAAMAQALRIVAVPAVARSQGENLVIALLVAVTLGATYCYGSVFL